MLTENDHIDDSNLKAIKTKGGFTVPQSYFENMRTHVLQQTSQTPKEKFYSVPDGYFETSRAAILAQTSHKKSTVRLWYKLSITKYAAAAIILISATLYLTKSSIQSNLQSMSDDDIILYLEENSNDINITDISFVVQSTQLNNEDHYLINTIDEQSIIEEL